jgi:hypothetical protein
VKLDMLRRALANEIRAQDRHSGSLVLPRDETAGVQRGTSAVAGGKDQLRLELVHSRCRCKGDQATPFPLCRMGRVDPSWRRVALSEKMAPYGALGLQ